MRAYYATKNKKTKKITKSQTLHKELEQSLDEFKIFILTHVLQHHHTDEFCCYLNSDDKGYEPWFGSKNLFIELYAQTIKEMD